MSPIPRFSDLDSITKSILRAAWAAEAAKKAAPAIVTPEAAQEARRAARAEHPAAA